MGLVQAQLKTQHEVLQLAAGCLPLHPPFAVPLSHRIPLLSIILDTVVWSSECRDKDAGVLWQLAASSHSIQPPFAVTMPKRAGHWLC